jgi:hypothetical protein
VGTLSFFGVGVHRVWTPRVLNFLRFFHNGNAFPSAVTTAFSAACVFAVAGGARGQGEGGGVVFTVDVPRHRSGVGCLLLFLMVRYCSGVWGWKTPSGVRGGAPRCCGWGCPWPPDSEGGRGRVRAAWLPPARIAGSDGEQSGGKPRVLARTTKTFFAGGLRRRVERSAGGGGARPQSARSFATSRVRAAGAEAEWNAPECPTKKEHGFHLVLDGASEASAVASPPSSP